jgi:hypothetical protein
MSEKLSNKIEEEADKYGLNESEVIRKHLAESIIGG